MSTHTTILGDTWDLIAYKTMGAEKYMQTLIRANPEHTDTLVFSAGVSITVPEIVTPDVLDLPFWHSGDDNSIWLTE